MSDKAERKAAQLLDQYVDAVMAGKAPDIGQYLTGCPERYRADLVEAADGLAFLLDNAGPFLATRRAVSKAAAAIAKSQRLEALSGEIERTAKGHPRGVGAWTVPVLQGLLAKALQALPPPANYGATGPAAAILYRGAGHESPRPAMTSAARVEMGRLQAREHAKRLLGELGSPTPPVDVQAVARTLGLPVLVHELSGCDGCIHVEADLAVIVLNQALSQERRRFTLAHELGHYDLHRNDLRFLSETWEQIENPSGQARESEANAYAAELLIPSPWAASAVAPREPSFQLAAEVAQTCIVSLTAGALAVVQHSNYACAVLFTEGDRIRWSVTSSEFPYCLARDVPPHRYTAAAALMGGLQAEDRYCPTQAEWWAPDDPRARDRELLEHSRTVGRGRVLTMLFAKELPDDAQ